MPFDRAFQGLPDGIAYLRCIAGGAEMPENKRRQRREGVTLAFLQTYPRLTLYLPYLFSKLTLDFLTFSVTAHATGHFGRRGIYHSIALV